MKKIILFLLLGLVIFFVGCGDILGPIMGERVTANNRLSLSVKIKFSGKEVAQIASMESDDLYRSQGDVLTGVVIKEGKAIGTLRPFTVPQYSNTHKHLWDITSYDPSPKGE